MNLGQVGQLHSSMITAMRVIAALILMFAASTAFANKSSSGVGVQTITMVDVSRTVNAAPGFAGSPTRRIDVTIWYPASSSAELPLKDAPVANGSPRPLVIWSHGSYGRADGNMHLVNHLVRAGYIVAAPDYPLSSRAAYTMIKGVNIADVGNQTKDIRFILDQLLASGHWSGQIDKDRIATIGHSLGAVTSYFTSFGSIARDPRIKASVLMGAGDPVQAALAIDMGLIGNWNVPSQSPVLFLSGEHDAFALINGNHHSAYYRVSAPKYEIMIKGGVHIWFGDAGKATTDGSNPDCAMLAGFRAGTILPGCAPGTKLISPRRQQEITRIATLYFLDGYLKGETAKLGLLRKMPKQMPDIELLDE